MFVKLLTGNTLEDLEKKVSDYLNGLGNEKAESFKLKIHHVHSFITQEVQATPTITGPRVITKFSLMIIASYE